MRATNRKMNDDPEGASRPMSARASGFIPGSGSVALVLEDLGHAQKRGAKIYAEVLGWVVNNCGQRQGGTMTFPNYHYIRKCISLSVKNSQIKPTDIDLICVYLTATMGDTGEINVWSEVLQLKGKEFPYINSAKSLICHCIVGAGSIESVAAILQINSGLHGNKNSENLHPEIVAIIDRERVPLQTIEKELNHYGLEVNRLLKSKNEILA